MPFFYPLDFISNKTSVAGPRLVVVERLLRSRCLLRPFQHRGLGGPRPCGAAPLAQSGQGTLLIHQFILLLITEY